MLLVIADVIVPRYGDSPAASEIDLIPQLQRLIKESPARARVYANEWVKLVKIIEERVPVVGGKPDPDELARHLQVYHRRYRRTKKGGDLGRAFEQLRRESEGKDVARPSNWGGLRVTPIAFEFWQGRDDRLHDRFRYSLQPDDGWDIQRLWP